MTLTLKQATSAVQLDGTAATGTQPVQLPAARPAARRGWWSGAVYPPGACNANWFSLFNAVSWQITLGPPAILYAQSEGASKTVLGLIASLMPLLVVFQIPAAYYLPKYGYRRFILAGWGSRTAFIFAIAAIPLLQWIPAAGRLALLVGCLVAFNLLRGITAGAWMPWISELIPADVRGRFLSRDQGFMQFGSILTLATAAMVLSGRPQPWQFSLVFLISALGGTLSLLFLRRVPDVTAPEKLRCSGHRVPWRAMMAYPPFLMLIVFSVLYLMVTAGLPVFTVAYLKGEVGYAESTILWMSVLGMAGALVSVGFTGRLLDRSGSRPVLLICLMVVILITGGWLLVAAGVASRGFLFVGLLSLAWGAASANFNVANSRLAMGTVPLMGRNHFFALYTVVTSLTQGLTPIIWGVLLDAMGQFEVSLGPAVLNRYSAYFAVILLTGLGAMWYGRRLPEGCGQQIDALPDSQVQPGGGVGPVLPIPRQ